MDWITSPDAWVALLTLTSLEIVLGIDNIVFLTILIERLPEAQRPLARRLGLGLAMVLRIVLLFSISWVMRLTTAWFELPIPWFDAATRDISGRDLILIGGGIFLLWKSTLEIHHKMEGDSPVDTAARKVSSFAGVLTQVALLDLVFSLDSVITAVGMADHIGVMVTAIVIAVGVMMLFAAPVGRFVQHHPTFQMLALSFLLLIGVALIGEGFDLHIPKGYIYFAMGFSALVETLNTRAARARRAAARAAQP